MILVLNSGMKDGGRHVFFQRMVSFNFNCFTAAYQKEMTPIETNL